MAIRLIAANNTDADCPTFNKIGVKSMGRREPALHLLTRFWVDVARSDSAKLLDGE
jgi:hypothetical protein